MDARIKEALQRMYVRQDHDIVTVLDHILHTLDQIIEAQKQTNNALRELGKE